eukprot:CAMPEP_0202959756 /NCGR_PEP_ID=MMETSP1396-20130829/3935_1 /ASSEMBLY_ACC=CAM_ASM_000872 /TAXON_ID= /ORGANISM="Pseudokeronopsis sp., Strain Brazil" /LENGTH=36 /DNA_ID= /DNA_START= /DNA_END= /DNA_ORIENTATION=
MKDFYNQFQEAQTAKESLFKKNENIESQKATIIPAN